MQGCLQLVLTIDTPICPSLSIDILVADTCGVASTRLRTCAAVNADFQAHGMDLVGGPGYAVWK